MVAEAGPLWRAGFSHSSLCLCVFAVVSKLFQSVLGVTRSNDMTENIVSG